MKSRPLTPLPCDDGVEALTPGHFPISRPLRSLPYPSFSCFCDAGTCANLLYVTSGKGGAVNMSLLSDNSRSGIIHQEMSNLEMLLSCRMA